MKAVFVIDFEDKEEIYRFENWLKRFTSFNLTILPDTEKLYQEDDTFKKLVKIYNEAKKSKNDYINKHNFNKLAKQ